MKKSSKILIVPIIFSIIFSWFLFKKNIFGFEIGSSGLPVRQIWMYYLSWISLVFAITSLINRFLDIFFWKGYISRKLNTEIPKILIDLSTLLFYLVSFVFIFGYVFQRPLTGLWATSGVIGIVLGLAMRSMIQDVLIGLAIYIENPYNFGDFIRLDSKSVSDMIGKIVETNWRTTRLQTIRGNIITIPNSIMGTSVVTNFQQPKRISLFEENICIGFHIPTERVRRVLLAGVVSLLEIPGFIKEKPPKVLIKGIGKCGINYLVRYWTNPSEGIGPSKARDKVYKLLVKNLQNAGIPLAYPNSIVYHESFPEKSLDTQKSEDQYYILSRIHIFSSLSKDQLDFVVEHMECHFFRQGDQLIKFGDKGSSMFIVEEGLLSVNVDFNGSGNETSVGQIQAGEFFGEMSLLTGESRSATVTTLTDSVCIEIGKEIMQKLFIQNPDLAGKISETIASRQVMNDLANKSASEKEIMAVTKTLSEQMLEKIQNFFSGGFHS